MSVNTNKETMGFQTEVKQLLNLMIHSLYRNKEIFLRELISNASDAVDRLRFEALSKDVLYEGDTNLRISVDYDKKARTVTVSDNGIGMARREVVDHIGTIARSGTRHFFESLTGNQAKDAQLIGQFGVGFYSAFIVAEKVTLITRRAGSAADDGVRWESDGKGEYTLENIKKNTRGTDVILHLRKGEDEFLESERLRFIIRKYSDHINLPIVMKTEGKEGEDTINRASALWARPKKDITNEEYKEFYKHVSHDFDDPLTWIHSRVEGKQSYIGLLYLPKHAPFDLWDRDYRRGIKLYVRRVFIMDDAEHFMPHYLRFIHGVIDSDDLPLNISRETLQHNKMIDTIRLASVKKVLDLLEGMAKNKKEDYAVFWNEFGRVLKEGPAEDSTNRERIAGLLRFASTQPDSETQDVSLSDYISRMKPGQKTIYYLIAESFAAAKNSPHLEQLGKKGIEVLLLSDRVDEWLFSHLSEYQGRPLHSAARGDLDLGDLAAPDEKQQIEEATGGYKTLLEKMKHALGDKIKEVRISRRLSDSPSCLVLEEHDLSMNLRKMLRAAGHSAPTTAPILEINPAHPIIVQLNMETDDQRFTDWTHILFDQAMLTEGGKLDDPAAFVRRINNQILKLSKTNAD
jgi:molecular chaperone HtpG